MHVSGGDSLLIEVHEMGEKMSCGAESTTGKAALRVAKGETLNG